PKPGQASAECIKTKRDRLVESQLSKNQRGATRQRHELKQLETSVEGALRGDAHDLKTVFHAVGLAPMSMARGTWFENSRLTSRSRSTARSPSLPRRPAPWGSNCGLPSLPWR